MIRREIMNMKSIPRVLAIMAMLVAGTVTSFQAVAHDDNGRDRHRGSVTYQQRDHHGIHRGYHKPGYMHHDRKWHRKMHRKMHKRHVHHHGYYGKGHRRYYDYRPGYYLDDGRLGITLYYRGTL